MYFCKIDLPVNCRISQASIVGQHVHLGSDSTFLSSFSTILHLIPHFHILVHWIIPVFGFSPRFTFGFHCFSIGVIDIGFAFFDQFFTIIQNGFKMVRSPGEMIILDPEQFQVFQDNILILFLFLGRISVIKSVKWKISFVLIVFPRKFLINQSALEFLFLFWFWNWKFDGKFLILGLLRLWS